MKTLTINEREHELSFGIAFIRELDKKFCSNVNGMNFGAGVRSAVVYLLDGNPVILVDIIQAATITNRSRLSEKDIEKWLEEQDDLDVVFDDFLTCFKTSKLTKKTTMAIVEAVEQS